MATALSYRAFGPNPSTQSLDAACPKHESRARHDYGLLSPHPLSGDVDWRSHDARQDVLAMAQGREPWTGEIRSLATLGSERIVSPTHSGAIGVRSRLNNSSVVMPGQISLVMKGGPT